MNKYLKRFLAFQAIMLTLSICSGICLGFGTYFILGPERANEFVQGIFK